MSRALSRRAALRGSVAASLGLMAGVASAQAAPTLSANDRRLVDIAAELQAIDDRLTALAAANDKAEDLPEWDALIERFRPLEQETAETPAATLIGILAKARASRVSPVLNCINDIGDSIAADLLRLFGGGADA